MNKRIKLTLRRIYGWFFRSAVSDYEYDYPPEENDRDYYLP